MQFPQWLLYITNNADESRHEEAFDIAFFLINSAALLFGLYFFISNHEPEWVPFLVIEYVWALDTIRHNRP